MGEEILVFGNIEIGKNKFYHKRSPIFLKKMLILKSISI